MNLSTSALALAFSAALMTAQTQIQPQKVVVQAASPMPKIETVHDVVAAYFSDIPIMVAVSGCESHFRQFSTSGDVIRGEQNNRDVGVMQINEDYHLDTAQLLGINIYTIEGNMAYARYLYEHEGTAPWSSSQYCWSRAARSAKVAVTPKSVVSNAPKLIASAVRLP